MKKVRVYPHPRLAETNEYVPGVGVDGGEVSEAEAEQLSDQKLIVRSKPKIVDSEPEVAE